jgi:Domain of unknown function (DUF4159)
MRRAWWLVAGGIAFLGAGFAWQAGPGAHVHNWQEFPAFEYNDFPIPRDYQEKTEWAYARLMYPNMPGVHGGGGSGFRGGWGSRDVPWQQGGRGVYWTMDYPRSDRHFSEAVRRLTRIHARSVEQPVNLDEGDQFDWPWLYAVEVGHWNLTDAHVKAFREYFDRGGFFMCDDFHGDEEWAVFLHSMKRVFPDREIVDIPKDDPIFHTIYDLDEKYQVPGEGAWVRRRMTSEYGGVTPMWRGIYDSKGRIVVAICHNMDLGDSWEHADNPEYPQHFSALGIRIGVDYLVYAMSH